MALYWAHRVRDQFPDGQLYIDLRGYDPGVPLTADQALERFLRALDVPAGAIPNDVEAKSSLYRSILADRHMLIILDNAATVGQVRPLIPGTANNLVIVTSRSRLSGLVVRDGARRTTLDILAESEAVALLTATMAGYRIGDDSAELAELARLCAYLPLALRIAAERAASRPSMPLSELIGDLRDESALWEALSTGDEDEVSAVRTVFAWSYRALPGDAASLFCLLGLHPGAEFSEDAAAALAGGEAGHVHHCLDVLAGAYLLEHRGFARYQFHDLLRAYAVDRARYEISQGEQLATVERICAWYLYTAYACVLAIAHDTTLLFSLDPPPPHVTPLVFSSQTEAARWFTEEKSNLAGAVRAAAESGILALTWRLSAILERIYATYNHFQDWQSTSLIGLEVTRRLGTRSGEAIMCESLGTLSRMTMRLEDAAEYQRASAVINRELGDTLSSGKALNGLGWVYLFGHRLEQARAELVDALAIFRGLGDRYWTATVLYSLGYTYLQLERPDDAEPCLAESLAIFRELDDLLYEALVLTALSLLERRRGQAHSGLTLAQRSVDITRGMANILWEGTTLLYLGKAQRAAGQPGDALVSYQRATVIFRQEGDLSREAMAVDGAGCAYQDLGRTDEAAGFHRYATTIHRQLGDHWKLAKSLSNLADVLAGPNVQEEAADYRREALALLADYPDRKSAALRARIRTASRGYRP